MCNFLIKTAIGEEMNKKCGGIFFPRLPVDAVVALECTRQQLAHSILVVALAIIPFPMLQQILITILFRSLSIRSATITIGPESMSKESAQEWGNRNRKNSWIAAREVKEQGR